MDLGLTLGSLVAIVILAFLASKMFPNRGRLDDDRVSRNLMRYEPDADIGDIFIDATGKFALVALKSPAENLGLVRLLGDRAVCRLLTDADIRSVFKDHARITLVLNDFTQPEITLTMSNDTLKSVADLLEAFTNKLESAHAA